MAIFRSNTSSSGRYLQLTVVQNGEYVDWTLESIGGTSRYYSIYNLHVKINNETVFGADGKDYLYNSNNTAASNPFPVSVGSASGSVYIGKNATTVPIYFYGAVYSTSYCKDYGGTLDFKAVWTAAGGATVDRIIDNGDNTITVTCTMGADGYNNAVYDVHIYGFVDRSDGIPSPGDHDFSASGGSISGRTVTFTIPAPSSKSSYMVRICAYSISQKGDNPGGYPVNSGTINRYSVFTIAYDANGGTGAPASHSLAENEWGKLSTQIPTRKGYKFIGWQDHNDYVLNGVTWHWYTFDAPYYANSYSDLLSVFGYDKCSLINHWVNSTLLGSEGRTSSQLFYIGDYMNRYPALGTDKNLCAVHWNDYGYNEARIGINTVINDDNDVYPSGATVKNLAESNGATVILTAKWEPLPYSVNINKTWVPCTIKVNVVGEGYICVGESKDHRDLQDFDYYMANEYGINVQGNEDMFYATQGDLPGYPLIEVENDGLIAWEEECNMYGDNNSWTLVMKSNNVKQWVDCTIQSLA